MPSYDTGRLEVWNSARGRMNSRMDHLEQGACEEDKARECKSGDQPSAAHCPSLGSSFSFG